MMLSYRSSTIASDLEERRNLRPITPRSNNWSYSRRHPLHSWRDSRKLSWSIVESKYRSSSKMRCTFWIDCVMGDSIFSLSSRSVYGSVW